MALATVSLQYATTPAPFSVSLEKSAEISTATEISQQNNSGPGNSTGERNQQGTVIQLRNNGDGQTGFSPKPPVSNELLNIQEQYLRTFEEISDVPTQKGPLFDEEKTALNHILSQLTIEESPETSSIDFVI